MSLRMEISGFDYAQMASYLGSKDPELKQRLWMEFQTLFSDPEDSDGDTHRKAGRFIETAVDQGLINGGPETEDEVCCHVVNLLAHHKQSHIPTDSSEWKMGVLWDIQDQYASRLSDRMNTFLGYFVEGRPLLGKTIQTSWSYYAYLLNREVNDLAKEVAMIQKQFQGDSSFAVYQDFFEALEDWLLAILENQKDLWFWAE